MARIVKLIYTEAYRGTGTQEDPCRMVPQLWTLDGELVMERDPQKHHGEEVRAFYRAGHEASE